SPDAAVLLQRPREGRDRAGPRQGRRRQAPVDQGARDEARDGAGDPPLGLAVRVIELRDDRHGLEAFVVVDHDLFPVAAGGTRMLPDVDVGEVARPAPALTWESPRLRGPASCA